MVLMRCAVMALSLLMLSGCKSEGGTYTGPPPVIPANPPPSGLPPAPLPAASPSPAPQVQVGVDPMNPANWEIGPIINGKNSSVGMPLNPSWHHEGWVIELPQPNASVGHVHYVTMKYGSLAGKRRITMRYRIEADPGVVISPRNFPSYPALLSLYFQRSDDNWSAQGKYETYRWWASFGTQVSLVAGQYQTYADLSENWTAVLTSKAHDKPAEFQAAVNNAGRVGFTLGGGDGLGHGIVASGPARLIVTAFTIE